MVALEHQASCRLWSIKAMYRQERPNLTGFCHAIALQ